MKTEPVLYNESPWFTYFLVVLFFISLAYVTLLHHEMWRDELQAWLIATGSASVGDLFQNIRHERHPAIWYLSLYLLSRLSGTPMVMQVFHILLATAGVYLLARFAPFTKAQKFCFAFGYFPFYEYGVISRCYVMGVVCLFAFCALQSRTSHHTLVQACVLVLLANTSIYGAAIAFAFGIYFVVAWLTVLREKQGSDKSRILLLSLFVVGLGVASSIVQIVSPEIVQTVSPDMSLKVQERITSIKATQARKPLINAERVEETLTAIRRSYLPIPRQDLHFWNTNILDEILKERPRVERFVTIGLLGLAAWVLVPTPVTLLVYAVATVALLALTHVTHYGIPEDGGVRHIGYLFLGLVGCIWISLSRTGATETPSLRVAFSSLPKAMSVGRIGMVSVLLGVHAVAGALAVRADLQYPFSASKDVAQFLKEHDMADMVMIGSRDYAVSSVSGYLGRALYYAEADRLGTFIDWGHKRRPVSTRELSRKAENFAALEHRDVLLILNYDLGPEAAGLVKIRSFDQSIVKDERYVLYRKSYCMDDAIQRSLCVSGNHPPLDSK
jgi:hypothetical protein